MLYRDGLSIPQIAEHADVPRSRVRSVLVGAGIQLRTRTEGMILSIPRRKTPERSPLTEEQRERISQIRLKWADRNAIGVSEKAKGYAEFTRGPHKGRLVHIVIMEERLGRPLRDDEEVHHIDGNGLNNEEDNLALLTKGGHGRLHRHQEKLVKEAIRGRIGQ